jgi:cell division protein FtsW
MPVFVTGGACDRFLLFLAIGLASFGLVMVYSASYIYAQEKFGDGVHYFNKHLLFLGVGFALLFFFRFFNFKLLEKFALPLFCASVGLMVLTMIPGVGHKAGGASRWILFFGFSMQPIEISKYALILYISSRFSRPNQNWEDIKSGFFFHLWPLALFCLLSILQPDFGSMALGLVVFVCLFYLAGVRLKFLLGSAALIVPAFLGLMVMAPYRRARLMTFLDPWADPQGAGFQIIQSFLAFHRGGLFGVGLGNSRAKIFYLPEAHNDFILSVVGEELGFLGVGFLCFTFLLFFFRGVRIAAKAENKFGSLLAAGLILLIGMQAFWNAAIVLGLFPTKGMNLPFISSGGSSVVALLAAIGVLLNISAQAAAVPEKI